MSVEKRICKICLRRDAYDKDVALIDKYKEAIDLNDRVSDEEYERRLTICSYCDKLSDRTCMSCGCYVELRAFAISGRCPNKKW